MFSEMRQSSVDFSTLQSSATKPAIAQAGMPSDGFFNKIEYANTSGKNRKRKNAVPLRKVGYQTSESGSRLS